MNFEKASQWNNITTKTVDLLIHKWLEFVVQVIHTSCNIKIFYLQRWSAQRVSLKRWCGGSLVSFCTATLSIYLTNISLWLTGCPRWWNLIVPIFRCNRNTVNILWSRTINRKWWSEIGGKKWNSGCGHWLSCYIRILLCQ